MAITITDGAATRGGDRNAHNDFADQRAGDQTESTRTNSEWDEEESAGSARGPLALAEDDSGAGVCVWLGARLVW